MKKILFAIAIVLTMVVSANAQRNDGFFSNWNNDIYGTRDGEDDPLLPLIPGVDYSNTNNSNAPLGSGLIILSALGAGYTIARKHKKE